MELDQSITEVIGTNRHIGPHLVRVRLAQKKLFVSRERVRTACAPVDPDRCSLRSWEIVIHGGIDGYSRMVTFLKACNNNRSITVFNEFMKTTIKYGIPSREWVDKGIENNDVCLFMEDLRGNGRNSAIRGKSPHNQRIERLWVDVWENVSVLTKFNSQNKPIKEVVEQAGNHDELQNSLPPEDYGVGD
ncbi:Hypothetical predicted protein [Mytilus galloprovincialis]|uniref:Integrase core domain-containing protein n=1 Tax=Mytilus galloprovincialis TaxID=29158 RepID=A0A8B6D9N4_MYTGA|nr:Hypothetical predicted protein [Mytilus galloprovincialis]